MVCEPSNEVISCYLAQEMGERKTCLCYKLKRSSLKDSYDKINKAERKEIV